MAVARFEKSNKTNLVVLSTFEYKLRDFQKMFDVNTPESVFL